MLPKFSLRLILLLLTAAAGLSAVFAQAWAGESWAIAISVAFGWMAFALFLHAFLYGVSSFFGRLGGGRASVDASSKTGAGR